MIQIAIVEDDKHQAQILQKYIARYNQESGQRFQATEFQDGEDIIEAVYGWNDGSRGDTKERQRGRHYLYYKYASICNEGVCC